MILSSISTEVKKVQKLASKNITPTDNEFLSVLLATKETARNKNNKSYALSQLATLATVPTAKELAKKQSAKNLAIDLATVQAEYVDSASKKKKKAETLSRIVTLPDGTRLLLITIEINGRTIQLSMKLSDNSQKENELADEMVKENSQQVFEPEQQSLAEDNSLMSSGITIGMLSE